MADGDIDATACERTHNDYGVCDYCGKPLPPPHPKWHGKTRRFCRSACRAAWRRTELDRRVQGLIDAANDLQAFLGGHHR